MKKLIKLLPAMAILVGGGLSVATIQKSPEQSYYRDPTTGVWTSLEGLEPGDQEGQYQCNEPTDNMCTAEFLIGQTPSGHIEFGTFTIVGP